MNPKESIIGKISLLSFLTQVIDEIKKVTWPTRQQIIKLSTIVIVSSLVVALYVGTIDYIFIRLIGTILNK